MHPVCLCALELHSGTVGADGKGSAQGKWLSGHACGGDQEGRKCLSLGSAAVVWLASELRMVGLALEARYT
jgi:hypothetical protein